jgi:hypothetical protein
MQKMTREEIQAYIDQAVRDYFHTAIYRDITPGFNLPAYIINQLTNYSRN